MPEFEHLTADDLAAINREILKKSAEETGEVNTGGLGFVASKVENTRGVFRKCAVLMLELIKSRPFSLGNLRTAWEAGSVFMQANNRHFVIKENEEVLGLIMDVQDGKISIDEVEEWVEKHSH
jgi:death-on-curing family protein